MFHGFMMGAVAASGGYMIFEHANSLGKAGMIASNAVLSGTVSEIGGGKFANGAVTGAFAMMFNDMMHNYQSQRYKTRNLRFTGKNTLKNRIAAMKYMVKRSQFTGNEVSAAVLEDGSVVVYHDGESTNESSMYYYDEGFRKGKKVYVYNGVIIKTFIHTHPMNGLDRDFDNPLRISGHDLRNACDQFEDINILLLDGSFYRQFNVGGSSIYQPNCRGNIFNDNFHF